jgi:hypothetical protein
MLQTEFDFILPRGYVDAQGNLHRRGTMRLATALDEIEPLQDARVRTNEAYLSILVLSRVITRLGELREITPALIEGLFSADLTYLQYLYIQVNDQGASLVETQCPACGKHFALDLAEGAGNE